MRVGIKEKPEIYFLNTQIFTGVIDDTSVKIVNFYYNHWLYFLNQSSVFKCVKGTRWLNMQTQYPV